MNGQLTEYNNVSKIIRRFAIIIFREDCCGGGLVVNRQLKFSRRQKATAIPVPSSFPTIRSGQRFFLPARRLVLKATIGSR